MATRVRLFDLQPSGRSWPDEAYEEMLKYQGKLSILYFFLTVAINKLLCMKNADAQIAMDFQLKGRFGTHGN